MYGDKPRLDTPNSLRYQLFAKAAAKTNFNSARLPPTAVAAKFHFVGLPPGAEMDWARPEPDTVEMATHAPGPGLKNKEPGSCSISASADHLL
ncbi:hypothetical protein JTB14_022607 [Gonioctena quinquepunctata]|nr:hypothetical protein JTB14_022607 [Gonioctena quinquepunctata]